MKDTAKMIVAGGAVLGGLYLLSRQRAGLPLFGGSGSTFGATPASPSPLGPTNVGTNPIAAVLTGISTTLAALAFKTSGNARAIPSASSGPAGSSTPYYKPPATAPFGSAPTAQPPTLSGFPTTSPGLYLPNYGDPNYNDNAVDAWMFGGGAVVPDMSGSNQAGTLGTGFAPGTTFVLNGVEVTV